VNRWTSGYEQLTPTGFIPPRPAVTAAKPKSVQVCFYLPKPEDRKFELLEV